MATTIAKKSLWKAGGNMERSKGKGSWGEKAWQKSEEEELGGRTVLKEMYIALKMFLGNSGIIIFPG